MVRKYLRGAAYALGEEKRDYSDIAGFEEAANAKSVPLIPEMAGLGSFFVTKDIYSLGLFSVGKTFLECGVAAERIDHVILCSTFFKEEFLDRNRQVGRLLKNWRIRPRTVRGISGTGCVDVLSSIDLACSMLELGQGHAILVVGLEYASTSDVDRLLTYGLMSDAATSLIVTDHEGYDKKAKVFEIVSNAIVSQTDDIGEGMKITSTSPDRNLIRNLLAGTGQELGDVVKIFGGNVFLHVKESRESLVGFTRAQMYLQNVSRVGHCLGCDSIINLVDFGHGQFGSQYILHSEAEGHTGCIVLRQCTPLGGPNQLTAGEAR